MDVLASRGTCFLTAGFTPTAFHDGPDPPRTHARFAFRERDEMLDEAVARPRRHFRERDGTPARY